MRPRRRPAWHWTTLLISIALAATLGATIYFTTSSLPYLASSPSTDPTFGAINACLHHEVPSRTGFTVGRDARRAAAWSTNTLAWCVLTGAEAQSQRWQVAGVTLGAIDVEGGVWVVSQPGGLTSTLVRFSNTGRTEHGETGAKDLVATKKGVVLLEESGRLVALSTAGAATGLSEVPTGRTRALRASADGTLVAVTGDGAMRVFDAETLTPVRLEAPCDVAEFWWLRADHQALVECRADRLGLVIDVGSGRQETAPQARRAPSVLAGPLGPYVEPCDLLPCTAPDPMGAPR
jgi:hypothetical protein